MKMPEAEFEEAFQFFDNPPSGSLSHASFIKMVQSLGQTPTQEVLKNLLEGKPDEIDLAMAKEMMTAIEAEIKTKEDVINAFKVFDNRGDKCITVENFKAMMGGWVRSSILARSRRQCNRP